MQNSGVRLVSAIGFSGYELGIATVGVKIVAAAGPEKPKLSKALS